MHLFFSGIKTFGVGIVTILVIWQKTVKKDSDLRFVICVELKDISLMTAKMLSACDVDFQANIILILDACIVDV